MKNNVKPPRIVPLEVSPSAKQPSGSKAEAEAWLILIASLAQEKP